MGTKKKTSTRFGKAGEKKVLTWLAKQNVRLSITPDDYPYDLIANGWRCEVKTSSPSKNGLWRFNIHRHGKMTEYYVDFYIFCLIDVPFCGIPIYVIKKAPLKTPTVTMSFRTLITKHRNDIENVKALKTPSLNDPSPYISKNRWYANMPSYQPDCDKPKPFAKKVKK